MDRQSAYALSVYGPETDDNGNVLQESRSTTEKQLMNFILEFQLDGVFVYRYVCQTRLDRRHVDSCTATKYEKTS